MDGCQSGHCLDARAHLYLWKTHLLLDLLDRSRRCPDSLRILKVLRRYLMKVRGPTLDCECPL
jgi:hypothetical protein